jgi:transaldolase/glucose-6-phosphate isomerase
LIGRHTINTIPPATLNAFRDHGPRAANLEAGQQDPERALARLAKRVSTWGAITEKLLADGITAFIPFFGRAASLLEGETQRAALGTL